MSDKLYSVFFVARVDAAQANGITVIMTTRQASKFERKKETRVCYIIIIIIAAFLVQ